MKGDRANRLDRGEGSPSANKIHRASKKHPNEEVSHKSLLQKAKGDLQPQKSSIVIKAKDLQELERQINSDKNRISLVKTITEVKKRESYAVPPNTQKKTKSLIQNEAESFKEKPPAKQKKSTSPVRDEAEPFKEKQPAIQTRPISPVRDETESFKEKPPAKQKRAMSPVPDEAETFNETPPAIQKKSKNSVRDEAESLKDVDSTGKGDDLETLEISTQTLKCKRNRDSTYIKYVKPSYGIRQITSNLPKAVPKKIRLMDWKRFHRLKVIYDFMEDLERDYPSICTVSVIGKTVEGRDIKMLRISSSVAGNAAVWVDGCIHPREWISTAVVTYLADYIARNFHQLPTYITNKDWHIVPVLNPDGYEYTHTHERMWRKNRARLDGENVGVDLNRNFSYGWGNNGEEGSSEEPSSLFYRGPEPFSEPEAVAVRDTILGSNSTFKVFLSFHSYFELIIFPWGWKTDPCGHYLQLLEAATRMSRAIYNCTGYIYKVGSTKDMTYFACGTSTDWSYGVAQIPYSFMVELRSRKHRFKLPKNQILDTCLENLSAVKSLMEYVDSH